MDLSKWTNLLIDSISIGVCIIDRDYTVLHWNDYMQDYTRIQRKDIVGKPIANFFSAFNEELYKDMIDSIFDGWPPVFLSSRLHAVFNLGNSENHEIAYQNVTVSSLLNEDKTTYYALISINDVTELNKKLEERNHLYKQAQKDIEIRERIQTKLAESDMKYRELNKTKDKLISIISHDLRGPISLLAGYLEILNDSYDTLDENKRIHIINVLFKATKNTFNLVENILTWATNQVKGIKLLPGNFPINNLIREVVTKIECIAANKGVRIIVDDSVNYWVYADRDIANTVLRNLISNAIKYSLKEGVVYIRTEKLNEKLIEVFVDDSGVGMSEDTMKKLFKLGESKSVVGTNNEEGTGFGLILCKEFVESNGGTLTFKSQLGKGSVFSFTIPVSTES